MKCPGCGAVLVKGSEYCKACGGKVEGSSINYAQRRQRAADVYEDKHEDESSESPPLNPLDAQWLSVMVVGFTVLLYGSGILSVFLISAGYLYNRVELYYVAVFFIAMCILLSVLAVKYVYNPKYERKTRGLETDYVEEPPPRRFPRKP